MIRAWISSKYNIYKDDIKVISIPAVPLPEMKTILRVLLFSKNCNILSYSDKKIFFYSRGLWALSEGIKSLQRKKKKKNLIIWFPNYFCNESLYAVRQLPVKIIFYPISKNLEPNWYILEENIIKYGPPDVFLLVHYFGFPNNLKRAKEFCKKYKIDLIEDAAHVLFPTHGIGESGSVVIYSPRKVLALPEGGILVVHKELENYVKRADNVFINKAIITWFMKRFTQKIMIKLNIPWHKFWGIKGDQYLNAKRLNFLLSPNCSIITLKLMCAMEKEFDKVIQKRRENYNLLCEEMTNDIICPLFSSLPEHVCPYTFPILVKKKRDLFLRKLQDKGIPASSWPDLPPEVLGNKKVHKEAIWLQKHIILFLIHQSLSEKQMRYIVNVSKGVIKDK